MSPTVNAVKCTRCFKMKGLHQLSAHTVTTASYLKIAGPRPWPEWIQQSRPLAACVLCPRWHTTVIQLIGIYKHRSNIFSHKEMNLYKSYSSDYTVGAARRLQAGEEQKLFPVIPTTLRGGTNLHTEWCGSGPSGGSNSSLRSLQGSYRNSPWQDWSTGHRSDKDLAHSNLCPAASSAERRKGSRRWGWGGEKAEWNWSFIRGFPHYDRQTLWNLTFFYLLPQWIVHNAQSLVRLATISADSALDLKQPLRVNS